MKREKKVEMRERRATAELKSINRPSTNEISGIMDWVEVPCSFPVSAAWVGTEYLCSSSCECECEGALCSGLWAGQLDFYSESD